MPNYAFAGDFGRAGDKKWVANVKGCCARPSLRLKRGVIRERKKPRRV